MSDEPKQIEHRDRGGLAAPRPVTGTIFEGVAGRVHSAGDGLPYPGRTEYRDRSEVRRIVDQLVGQPVNLGHNGPKIGIVIEARLDGDSAIAVMLIANEAGLNAVRNGTRELSLGYRCDVDGTSHQRGIRIHELALVGSARCGRTCCVATGPVPYNHNTDSAEGIATARLRHDLAHQLENL